MPADAAAASFVALQPISAFFGESSFEECSTRSPQRQKARDSSIASFNTYMSAEWNLSAACFSVDDLVGFLDYTLGNTVAHGKVVPSENTLRKKVGFLLEYGLQSFADYKQNCNERTLFKIDHWFNAKVQHNFAVSHSISERIVKKAEKIIDGEADHEETPFSDM